jgi:uncharacterized cupredoxin-like copper-binding protein
MAHSRNRTLAFGLVLGASLLGLPGWTSAAGSTTPAWVTTSGNVVHLTLIAGYNNVNSGFNFDGAAHGQMVVTVPLGARVVASFKNNAQGAFHNAVIIPYTMPLPAGNPRPAFPGSETPAPRFRPGAPGAGGPPSSVNKPLTFSFTAAKAGNYMIVCGISGHAIAGMWDTFVVSPTAKVASVIFNKAAVPTTVTTAPPPADTSSLISTSGKVVHLTLIAGYNNANAGFNFDGGAHGQMVVTVPLGATVDAVFKNNVSVPHDVVIINYQTPPPSHTVATAFPGSASPRPRFRPPAGGQGAGAPPARPRPGAALPFSFVASKAGTYMIICGVPGHAIAGMWDTFVVSPTAKTASITFKS